MGMTHLESRVGISLGRRAEQEREREAGSRETSERAPRHWWPGPEAARKPSRSRQCWARGAKALRGDVQRRGARCWPRTPEEGPPWVHGRPLPAVSWARAKPQAEGWPGLDRGACPPPPRPKQEQDKPGPPCCPPRTCQGPGACCPACPHAPLDAGISMPWAHRGPKPGSSTCRECVRRLV